jgi:lipopolysaccharide export system permease protein
VPWHLLQRFILMDLLRVFVMALVAITGILVMAGVVAEASQQGLGPEQVLGIVPLLIPGFLPYTVPATCLFSVAVVYGRLAGDNEVTAIKAAGIPVTRVIWPGLLVGALASLAVHLLYENYIPRSTYMLRSAVIEDIEQWIYAKLRRDQHFNESKMGYSIWVREVQGRRLLYPTFVKKDAQGRDEIVAIAKEAELHVDLRQGILNVHMLRGEISRGQQGGSDTRVIFDEEIVPVPLPPIEANRRVRPRELTAAQLQERRKSLVELREEFQSDRDRPRDPPLRDEELRLHTERIQFAGQQINEVDTETAMRPALASSCIFFVLIGCPVGIWFHRRDYLSAFVTCFLPIVLVYYPLMMFGINMGKRGQLDPTYSLWMGNALLGIVGLTLLSRLVKR